MLSKWYIWSGEQKFLSIKMFKIFASQTLLKNFLQRTFILNYAIILWTVHRVPVKLMLTQLLQACVFGSEKWCFMIFNFIPTSHTNFNAALSMQMPFFWRQTIPLLTVFYFQDSYIRPNEDPRWSSKFPNRGFSYVEFPFKSFSLLSWTSNLLCVEKHQNS